MTDTAKPVEMCEIPHETIEEEEACETLRLVRRTPAGRLFYLADRLEAALEDGTLIPSVLATIIMLRTTAAELGRHETCRTCGKPITGRSHTIEAWGSDWHLGCLPSQDEIRKYGTVAAAVEARRDNRDR